MCWSANIATIFRFIDSLRSMSAWVWSWNDRRWRIGWEEAVSCWEPLVVALHRYVMTRGMFLAVDTSLPVLAPVNGQTKTGRLWTYVRDDRPAGDTAAPA